MGSFFSNIQVLAGASNAVPEIRQRLRDAIVGGQYEEHVDAMTPADRNVIIANTVGSRWVAVYDEDADAPDIAELERLASAVSRQGHALAVSVSDSDVLHLALFANGRPQERIVFNPSNRRHRPPRHPEWLRLLTAEQFHSFAQGFQSGEAFAEYPLERLAEYLGLNPDFLCAGYRYRDDLPDGPREVLRFCLRPEARFYERIGGSPDLSWSPADRRALKLSPGETVSITVPFLNQGGPGAGLTVAIPWPEGQEAILRIDKFRITCRDACQELEVVPELVSVQDDRFVRGRFPELRFNPFIRWSENASPAQLSKITEIINRHNMDLDATVTAIAPGQAQVAFFLMPVANGREGASIHRYDIEVRSA